MRCLRAENLCLEQHPMTTSGRFLVIGVFVLLVASCGDTREKPEYGPNELGDSGLSLTYDSLRLAEDEEVYIGNPVHLVVVPAQDGGGQLEEVWVSDFFSNSLLQFAGDGSFLRRIGQPGPGPHEFSHVTNLFLPNADQVGAVDRRRHEIKWFDRKTGELQRFLRHESGQMGLSVPLPLDAEGSTLMFPLLSAVSQTSLAILDLETETWTHTGPFPEPFRYSIEHGRGALVGMFFHVFVDRLDESTSLVAFTATDTVYAFDPSTQMSQPLGRVPRLQRRGFEGDCVAALELRNYGSRKDCAYPWDQFSMLTRVRVLDDGRIAVVHVDLDGGGQPPAKRVFRGTGFLTLLDRQRNEACVDLPLPGGDDAGTYVDIKQNTLYALDRRLKGDSLETWLLEVPIPLTADCPEEHVAEGWLVQER